MVASVEQIVNCFLFRTASGLPDRWRTNAGRRRQPAHPTLRLEEGGDELGDRVGLAHDAGVRYANALDEMFALAPDQVGAIALDSSGSDLLAMSRTYNLPSGKTAGTFGQQLPGIPADRMIPSGVKKRIILMNETDDVRSNVACQNAGTSPATFKIELFDSEGQRLGTRTMTLGPMSNDQITAVFRNYSPISAGYVDVWTTIPEASIYCYGSVLDNVTSDPTTVLPQ